MACLLDSNILLRLTHPDDPLHPIARRAVWRLRRQGEELVVFPQSLAEFWNVSTRPVTARGGYGQSIEETNQQLRSLLRRFKLREDVPGITRQWRRLVLAHRVSGVSVHDARLVAAMRVHGLTHILSFNAEDFRRYTSITAAHPEDVTP